MSETILQFSHQAWCDVLAARDAVPTEIGMALIPDRDDPLLIVGIDIPPQECTAVKVDLVQRDAAVWFARLESELEAHEYPIPTIAERYWLHTHPGNSADPSGTDITDFRTRQQIGYPVLYHVIVARGGATWGRIDIRIPGTDRYVESPMGIAIAKPDSSHIVTMARKMCVAPKPSYTYYGHNHSPNHKPVIVAPSPSKDQGPGIAVPACIKPATPAVSPPATATTSTNGQPEPTKHLSRKERKRLRKLARTAKQEFADIPEFGPAEQREMAYLDQFSLTELTDDEFARLEFLETLSIGNDPGEPPFPDPIDIPESFQIDDDFDIDTAEINRNWSVWGCDD